MKELQNFSQGSFPWLKPVEEIRRWVKEGGRRRLARSET